jgi:hypothetical protein
MCFCLAAAGLVLCSHFLIGIPQFKANLVHVELFHPKSLPVAESYSIKHFLLSEAFYQMILFVFGCDLIHLCMYELLRGVFLKFLSFVLQKLLLISNKN